MAAEPNRIPIGDRVTIYRRGKKGCYQADFHFLGHRRKSLRTSNKKLAMAKAVKLAAELAERTYQLELPRSEPSRVQLVSLEEARGRFLADKETDGRQPRTLAKYGGILGSFIAFSSSHGVERVEQATLMLFDEFRQMRRATVVRGRPLSDKQLHNEGVVLKQFFAWCWERKLIAENPLASRRLPRPAQRRKGRSLSLDQVNQLLAIAPKEVLGPLAVLAFTGMRTSNCRNLKVEDVDFEGGWIYVRSRTGARTKCGNEWKTPLHPRLRGILLPLRRHESGYFFRAKASHKYPRGDHWINTKRLNEDFLELLNQIGVNAGRFGGFTLHDLRRFFKSCCIAHDVPREYVDDWQGHAAIRSASDLYVETFDEDSQRHMQKVRFGEGPPAADAGSTS